MKHSSSLLVVAGEASGDVMAAPVVAHLGMPSFGLGGASLAAAGMELTLKLKSAPVTGFTGLVARSPWITKAALSLLNQARRRKPRAALLVGYSELNCWLGPRLRDRGIPVLWYGAPEIWSARPGRAKAVHRACDRMAVVLPFEQQLWQKHGVDARYVGHPALETPREERAKIRDRHGLTPYAEYLALLPGSQPHEVARHLKPMLLAVGLVRAERGALDARVILARTLDLRIRAAAARQANALGILVIEAPASQTLPAFDVAVAKSGTVTLECAVAGVPPVVVYKNTSLAHALSKQRAYSPFLGLPNVVLGKQIFPELVQERVNPDEIAENCMRLLEQRSDYLHHCETLTRKLTEGLTHHTEPDRSGHAQRGQWPSERVAHLIAPWLT